MSGRRTDGEGTIEVRPLGAARGRVYGRILRADGSRPWIPLGKGTKEDGRARLDALIARGRANGNLEALIDRLLEKNANTKRGRKAAEGKLTTVREIGEAWLKGELYKRHGAVNGLRPSSTTHNTNGYNANAVLNKRAYSLRTRPAGPLFGELLAADVKHEDIAKIMAGQGSASAGTRNHLHSYLSRIFALAEIPLGLRTPGTNPVLRAYRAPRDPSKHFNFLYPVEVLALLGNARIPIGRRVLYLLSTYFGWRKGTLVAFKWSGIDWEHGTVSVTHQKGRQRLSASEDDEHGVPIFFHVEPACVLAVLRAWWEHCGQPKGDQPVVHDLRGPEETWREDREDAKVLRADLKASGVTRAILFSEAKNVQPVRFHDGRATFCTWARKAGRSDTWIKQRTGHDPTSDMLDRYTRQAATLADLGYEPFPEVTSAIPELAPEEPAVCSDCARQLPAQALPTPVAHTPPKGANGRKRGSSGPRNEADRGTSRQALPVEVLAP